MDDSLQENKGKDPSERSLGRLLGAISRHSRMYLTSQLKDYDLMSLPLFLLHSLSLENKVRQESLIVQHGVDKAVMTRSLNSLMDKGLIEKVQDPSDRRAYLISLTKDGKNLKDSTKCILHDFNDKLLMDFSDSEKVQLFSYIDRLLENAILEFEE